METIKLFKKGLIFVITTILIISSFIQMTMGYNDSTLEKKIVVKNNNFDSYNMSETSDRGLYFLIEYSNSDTSSTDINVGISSIITDSLMDSPWPMYCHDIRHTSRSPYNTADNPNEEKWQYPTADRAEGSPVIGDDGTIYIGSTALYAIYPNGTLRWKYDTIYYISAAPAIDEDGTIYFVAEFGARGLHALYPNGTLKWKYKTGNTGHSSPVIGGDGTIYFGSDGSGSPPYSGWINAVYPNGTLKWRYKTEHFVHSSPAIDEEGIVYCGSHDGYLYALYPNGTLKWKFKTSNWVTSGPSIADDGTIYFSSWNGYLYALYPNSTLKWKSKVGPGTTPIIGSDGTVYVGSTKLHAIYPENGTVIWSFNLQQNEDIRITPCISADGIIYFGTHIGNAEGGELIAVNPDGTERWRKMIATDHINSAPAIGENGTIYIGSSNDLYHPGARGYLHAFGELDPDAPDAPTIKGPIKVLPFINYKYSFVTISPTGKEVYYYINWGDNTIDGWLGPYPSGKNVTIQHKWYKGEYTIKVRAKDTDNLWGPWGTLEITVPKAQNVWFQGWLERFSILQK